MVSHFDNYFNGYSSGDDGDSNMGKLLDNEGNKRFNKLFRKCAYLPLFILILIPPISSQIKNGEQESMLLNEATSVGISKDDEKKINEFERLTEEEKFKLIYKEILENRGIHFGFIGGTEYYPNDENGRIFLQLLDEDKDVIDSATCCVTLYRPDNTKQFECQIMTPLGENGIYYYPFTVGDDLGVYMASAVCYIPEISHELIAWDDFECDDNDCGSGWSSDWEDDNDGDEDGVVFTSQYEYEGDYCMRLGNPDDENNPDTERSFILDNPKNITVNFYARGRSIESNDYYYFYICDASDNCELKKTWNNIDENLYYPYSYTLRDTEYDLDGEINLIFNSSGIGEEERDYLHLDYFNVNDWYFDNITQYQTLKGGGEVHVATDSLNFVAEIGSISEEAIFEFETIFENDNPIEVFGTEYTVGDYGKIFIQYLNLTTGDPIDEASCINDIYFPNNTIWVEEGIMTPLGENGLHFYDITIPDTTGVYMVSAECLIPQLNLTTECEDDFESGGLTGGTGWSGNWVTGSTGGGSVSISTTNPYDGTYHLRMTGDGNFLNDELQTANRTFTVSSGVKSLTVDYYGYLCGIESGESAGLIFSDASGTEYNLLTLTDGQDDCVYNHFTHVLNNDTYDLTGSVKLSFWENVNFNNDIWDVDEVQILKLSEYNVSDYQFVRGGGELHVSNPEVNYTYFDEEFGNITSEAEINQTYFDEKFNQTFVNQQEVYNFIQFMNTTLVEGQEYIKTNLDSVVAYITDVMDNLYGMVIS